MSREWALGKAPMACLVFSTGPHKSLPFLTTLWASAANAVQGGHVARVWEMRLKKTKDFS